MKKKVLHFDDEVFIIGVLAKNLELFGWDVTLVSDVDELFYELNNQSYDIIIMDIMVPLPKLNYEHITFTPKEIDEMKDGINTGLVVTKKIWQMDNYQSIPVLFLSARREPDAIIQFMQEGHKCSFLRKPVLTKDITNSLEKLLNNKF